MDSPEFVTARLTVARTSVGRALDAGRPRLAFEAVQDGKAGILGDYRDADAPADIVDAGMRELVRRMRDRLCHWLHHERDDRIETELRRRLAGRADVSEDQERQVREAAEGELEESLERETAERTVAFLATWGTAHRDTRAAGARQAARERPPLASDEPAGLEQVQAALPPRWALLDFWISNDEQASVFVVTRDEFRVGPLPLRADDRVRKAVGQVGRWHDAGSSISSVASRPDALELFHDLLFEPLRGHLDGIEGIYAVPHKYLNAIPMHACLGEDGYLGEAFQFAYLPSAAWLPRLAPLALAGPMLTLANPERGTAPDLTLLRVGGRGIAKNARPAAPRRLDGPGGDVRQGFCLEGRVDRPPLLPRARGPACAPSCPISGSPTTSC